MRVLKEKDILEVLYGATLLGAGGGGSLKFGIDMMEELKKEGKDISIKLLSPEEIGDDEYAAMVAGLGSPVAMLDNKNGMFGPDAIYAFKAFQKAYAMEGKTVKYLMSGEMGGFNTFVPMLVSILSDDDPEKRIMMVDVDDNGRAVPELNTTLTCYYGHPATPLGMGSYNGNEIIIYPQSDHDGEAIARQLCMLYDMRIGFATWGMNKQDMLNDLVPGCITQAQEIGAAMLKAKENGADVMEELKKVTEIREFCRGKIKSVDLKQVNGFDCGVTTVEGDDVQTYIIEFKNENLILKDADGDVKLTAPEGIGLIDLDNTYPLTNADTKEGMNLLVTMVPAHPNWWDEDHKAYTCWLPEFELIGYTGGPVRY